MLPSSSQEKQQHWSQMTGKPQKQLVAYSTTVHITLFTCILCYCPRFFVLPAVHRSSSPFLSNWQEERKVFTAGVWGQSLLVAEEEGECLPRAAAPPSREAATSHSSPSFPKSREQQSTDEHECNVINLPLAGGAGLEFHHPALCKHAKLGGGERKQEVHFIYLKKNIILWKLQENNLI